MKILIVTNSDGGLYSFRKELVQRFLEQNEVFIALPYGPYIPVFEKMGCKFIETNFNRHSTNPFQEFKLFSRYKTILKSLKPDIVFTYTIKPNVYAGGACASLHIPYVANITGLGTAVENGGIMQKITCLLYKYGLRRAQKVFFQNNQNQNFMVEHKIVTSPFELLPGSGVNLSDYLLADYPKGETVDFVFVGRIMREKGINQYLDAARYIRNKYTNTRFHICGGFEQEYKQVIEKLNDDGIVEYHGIVSDMKPIYRDISCTVHPTYYPEGLSNVLLESCASGRPIITTNRPGCREVVEDHVNGLIVAEQDSSDLIQKIEEFLQLSWEERRQMGLEGRKKVEREFDRRIVVQKYMQELAHEKNN